MSGDRDGAGRLEVGGSAVAAHRARRPHIVAAVVLGALGSLVTLSGGRTCAAGLWEEVAAVGAAAAVARTGAVASPRASPRPIGPRQAEKRQFELRQVESRLRATAAAAPADFAARRELAEFLASSGRPREAIREFEVAVRIAPTITDQARAWFRIANEFSRVGAYAQALDAYERQLALGATDPAALTNSAELLMAAGRAAEAVDRYREAVLIEEREPNRRDHVQGIALGYFGLAVALDRAGHPVASREAMGRALALDPGLGVLRMAAQPDAELFFVPPGDVSYYLALARRAQGRTDDAAAAFRDYLRVGRGPAIYLQRAREHLAGLMAETATSTGGAGRSGSPLGPVAGASTQGHPLRVVHQATIRADGPLVAPLIDAAFRLDKRLLDACLSESPIPTTTPDPTHAMGPVPRFRLSVQLRIDETGRVGAARVSAPAALGEEIPRCIENALLTRFRVTRPSGRKPTHVRMELVLAPSTPGGV